MSDFTTALEDLELNDSVEPAIRIVQLGVWAMYPGNEGMPKIPSKLPSGEPRWNWPPSDNQITGTYI